MAVPVLLAVTGAPWEADVVRRAERAQGIRVVRRCVDIADVMAAAASGQARAVLLAEDLPRLTSDAIAALHARRIAVVALVDPQDRGDPSGGEDRLNRMGIERILPADVSADDLGRAILDAVESGPCGDRVPLHAAGSCRTPAIPWPIPSRTGSLAHKGLAGSSQSGERRVRRGAARSRLGWRLSWRRVGCPRCLLMRTCTAGPWPNCSACSTRPPG